MRQSFRALIVAVLIMLGVLPAIGITAFARENTLRFRTAQQAATPATTTTAQATSDPTAELTAEPTNEATAESTSDAARTATQTVAEASFGGVLTVDSPVDGTISNIIFRQTWRFDARAGQVIDLSAVRTDGNLNTYLALLTARGDVLAASDDTSSTTDSLISAFTLPYNGDYTIIVRRSGDDNGRTGTTFGNYRLTLRVRGGDTPASYSLITLESPVVGRWTPDQPNATYQIRQDGPVRLVLTSETPERPVRLVIIDQNGGEYVRREGYSPLIVNTALPPNRTLFTLITPVDPADGNSSEKSGDRFTLTAYRGSTRASVFQVITPGHSATGDTSAPIAWQFTAERGDYYRVRIQRVTLPTDFAPEQPVIGIRAILRDSREGITAQGTLFSTLPSTCSIAIVDSSTAIIDSCVNPGEISVQANTSTVADNDALLVFFPRDDLYELTISTPDAAPDAVPLRYQLTLEQIGANSLPFALLPGGAERGTMTLTPVIDTLTPTVPIHFWAFDARAGEQYSFAVSGQNTPAALAMALFDPDNVLIGGRSPVRYGVTRLDRITLPRDGRYRVLVFGSDPEAGNGAPPVLKNVPTLTAAASYQLIIIENNDSAFPSATPIGDAAVKSAVTAAVRVARITLPVAAGDLLTLRLQNFSRPIFAPSLTLIDPNGYSVARIDNTSADANGELLLTGIRATSDGIYTVQVGGILNGTFGEFRLFRTITAEPGRTSRQGLIYPVVSTSNPAEDPANEPVTDQTNAPAFNPALFVSTAVSPDLARAAGLGSISNTREMRGEITGDTVQGWRFSAAPGSVIRFSARAIVEATPDALTHAVVQLAPHLVVLAPDGTLLAESGANGTPYNTLIFRAGRGGSFVLAVSISSDSPVSSTSTQPKRYILGLDVIGNRTDTPTPGEGSTIRIGQSVGGELLGPEDSTAFYFTGTAGQVLDISALPYTEGGGSARVALALFSPAGVRLRLATNQIAGTRLPIDGLYHVRVSAVSPDDPRFLFRLAVMPGSGEIAEPLTDDVLNNGETRLYPFSKLQVRREMLIALQAGQPVDIDLTALNGVLPLPIRMRVEDVRGFTVDSVIPDTFSTALMLNSLTVTQSGVYRLIVEGGDQSPGTVQIRVQNSTPAPVLSYGSTGTGIITTTQSTALHKFVGVQGDVITLDYQFMRGDRFYAGLQIVSAEGVALATTADVPNATGNARLTVTLPLSGEYSAFIANPQANYDGAGVYQIALILNSAGNATAAFAVTATPTPTATSTAFQTITDGAIIESFVDVARKNVAYTFVGLAGDSVSASLDVQVDASLIPALEVRDENGTLLARAQSTNSGIGVRLPSFALPVGGTYTLNVTTALGESGRSIGLYTLRFSQQSGTVTSSTTIPLNTAIIGRVNDASTFRFTFNAKTGDTLRVSASATSGDLDTILTVRAPDGTLIAQMDDTAAGKNAVTPVFVVTQTGPHTVIVNRYGLRAFGTTGNYELRVDQLPSGYVDSTTPPGLPLGAVYSEIVTLSTESNTANAAGNSTLYERRFTLANPAVLVSVLVRFPSDEPSPIVTVLDTQGRVLATGRNSAGEVRIDNVQSGGVVQLRINRARTASRGFTPIAVTITTR